MPLNTNLLLSIVDDDESVREALAGLIKWLGYTAETFASALEFLGSTSLAGTACVITDVQMPHMTGIELHKRLHELGHAIPTIMITAYADDAARERALADGVVCYLSKPFDNEALTECIRSAVGSPHSGSVQ